MPLLREGSLIGGLVACRRRPSAFAAETVDLVQTSHAVSLRASYIPASDQPPDGAAPLPDRATELRLRRRAERQGLRLGKSRLRDPDASEFNTYRLVDQTTGAIVAMGGSGGFGLTLEQIEALLTKRSGE